MAVNAISCCRRLLISPGTDGCPLPTSKRVAAGLILRLWAVAGLCREQAPRLCPLAKCCGAAPTVGKGWGQKLGFLELGSPKLGPLPRPGLTNVQGRGEESTRAALKQKPHTVGAPPQGFQALAG